MYSVLIFPFKCTNYDEAMRQKEIIHALINYLYADKRICIYRQDEDYYGLYGKWFPYASIKKEKILYQDLAEQVIKENVSIVNFTGKKISVLNKKYKNYMEIDLQIFSVRKIHLYYAASQIAKRLFQSHRVQYYGSDSSLFHEYLKKFLGFENDLTKQEGLYKKKSSFYVLSDEITNEMFEKLRQSVDTGSVILFLNDRLEYMFYQPEKTSIVDHIIPYPILWYSYDENGEKKMKIDEAVLYAYTLDDELKKDLLSIRIQRLMDRIGVENDRTSIENAFLRGMLEATERKVLYLQQSLNELKNCN